MPRKKHMPTVGSDDYTEFLKSIDPVVIALLNSQVRVDRDRYFNEGKKKLAVAWRCVPTDFGEDYFEADASLIVKLSTGNSKPSVEIKATFRMHCHAPKPVNHDFVDRFTDSEVRLIMWPFFREYVSNISGRMYIPPIVLPTGARD